MDFFVIGFLGGFALGALGFLLFLDMAFPHWDLRIRKDKA